jgi:RNA polymerase sigma-70 factor (ECF subfamily)
LFAPLGRDRRVSDIEARMKGLMLRGLDGDATAHATLLSEMSRYLRSFFARRLGRDAADLEDLVQEALLAIHLKRETYDRAQPFTSWAYTIARYKMIDHLRRSHVRRTELLDEASDLFASEEADEGDAKLDLGRVLAELPPKQRALLEDVKIKGLSMREAGEKAGISEGAAKISVHRALKLLAKRFRDENG